MNFDKDALNEMLENKCIKKSSLCNKLHITPSALSKKLNGTLKWSLQDVQNLRSTIMTQEEMELIFFGQYVDCSKR